MQPFPKTPTTRGKADEKIEQLKQSLSAKWNISLPERGATWSPSHRDLSRLDEKICTSIQFLYFRNAAALDIAIQDFEKNARNVYSQWQYKPKAETDVIPSRGLSRDKSEGEFLRKRKELPAAAIKGLTETLYHHLSLVKARVQQSETFPQPNHVESRDPG